MYYLKKHLAGQFRAIVWDLPGLGQTEQPKDDIVSLEQMAAVLHQVLSIAQGKPIVLVGHSIGGMTNLTFAKALSRRPWLASQGGRPDGYDLHESSKNH